MPKIATLRSAFAVAPFIVQIKYVPLRLVMKVKMQILCGCSALHPHYTYSTSLSITIY
jgi:hypothetical protein